MLETTVVGFVARYLATRTAAGIRNAIAGDDLERALASVLDVAAEQVAAELAASRFGLSAEELADAIHEQIRSAAVQVSPDREEPSIAELLQTVFTEAFAPWSSVPMYGAVTTEQHFGIDVEDTAFSEPSETIVLEVDDSPEDARSERSPFPVFYVVVANYGRAQAVLKQVGVDVAVSEPLLGIPESRALKSLVTYEVPVPPIEGRHMRPAIPALRVAAEDAAAFHLRLCFAQSFATVARVVLDFGDQELLSSPVYLAF